MVPVSRARDRSIRSRSVPDLSFVFVYTALSGRGSDSIISIVPPDFIPLYILYLTYKIGSPILYVFV